MTQLQQAVSNEQLFAKLCAVETLLKAQQLSEHSRELWGNQQIADYFKVSTEHARRWIVVDPRFPAPVDTLSRTGGNSKNLYVSGEVVQFALKYRKKKASF